MAYVKVDIKTPDGRYHSTTTVNPATSGVQGRKVDPETGRTFEWRNDHGRITSRWVN